MQVQWMSETDAERLKALDARLAEIRQQAEPKHHSEEHYSQANIAWRMVIELVAGLGIGFGIGYGLDALLGTTPWMMLVFIFAGLAAGVKTMMRTAAELQSAAEQRSQDAAKDVPPQADGNDAPPLADGNEGN